MKIKDQICNNIKDSLKKMNFEEINFIVEKPNNLDNGDYSSNVGMELAKILKKNPYDLSLSIVDNLDKIDEIDHIEVVRPGFINFYLKNSFFLNKINDVISLNENYGKCSVGNNEKINIEYVSANPTGILHVGTARGAAYGDNLSRIYKFAGFNPTREYYINDGGNQINNLGLSIKVRYENLCGINSELPADGYYGEEIIEIAKSIYNEYQKNKINEDITFFTEIGVNKLMKKIKTDLKNFRVEFDVWTSEKTIRESGKIEACLDKLEKMGNIYQLDGAKWLKTSKYGDEKDRVIVKSDNTYTYLVPDIAYHLEKINRGYDRLIDVLGADHHGYQGRLKAAIEALGYDKERLEIKLLQMVKLIRDGKEIKMSKRTGKTVTISELIEEVGVDAARYFFASRSLDTQMNFDITLATKKSNDNPIYYIEYAHARICSILKNTSDLIEVDKYETITSNYAIDLIKKVLEFEDIVESSALKQMPHLIANYVYELATAFHSYYSHEKVISDDIKYTSERINLIKSTKITIKNALNLIGVEAFEEM